MRSRSIFITVSALILLAAGLLSFRILDSRLYYSHLEDYLSTHTITEDVYLYRGNTSRISLSPAEDPQALHAFIPSEMKDNVHVGFDHFDRLILDGMTYHSGDDITGIISSSGEVPAQFVAPRGEVLYDGKISFHCLDSVPTLYITTSENAIETIDNTPDDPTVAKPRIDGRMMIVESGGAVDSYDDITLSKRGNTTFFGYEMKPYNMNLNAPKSLLGMTPGRKWALKANAMDRTQLLRNEAAFAASRLSDLTPCPDTRYINLYLNGRYNGLYMLSQRVDATELMGFSSSLDSMNATLNTPSQMTSSFDDTADGIQIHGIDLPGEPEDTSGEYLLELDYRYEDEPCYFVYNEPIVVHSPEAASRKELRYIADKYRDARDAAACDGDYEKYIDVDSFVRMYIIQDFFSQTDVDFASFYFYLGRDGLFHAGPVWDFDLSCGMTAGDPYHEELTLRSRLFTSQKRSCVFLDLLDDSDRFMQRVSEYYMNDFSPAYKEYMENGWGIMTSDIEDSLAASCLLSGMEDTGHPSLDSAKGLASWIKKRDSFLTGYYSHPDDYADIVFHFGWGTVAAAVKKDEPIGFMPDDAHPGNDDAFWGEITGFVDKNGDPVDDSYATSSDTDLYAVYTEDSYAWDSYSLP